MHINDVGAGTWEEINVGAAGANFGWPTCEGACGTAGMTNPIYQYSSVTAVPCAITGGAFYNPTTQAFPGQFIGKYFFADFCGGWIKTIDPLNPPPTGTAVDAFTNISFPVDIKVANDGSLYYLARGASTIFRVQYSGGPALAINDLTIVEGNAGTSVATFNVILSPVSSQTVTVNYATANNSAAAGTDYVATSGTLTFAPGQTSQPVSVTINGDTTLESDETFNVNLSSPVNATLGDDQGAGTIANDDGLPAITINNVSVAEGNSGTTNATFTVSLSNTSSQTVTVNYLSAGNTATPGTDFSATGGTATIAPGLLSTTINIPINSDTTFEPAETFFVNLSGATNATISDNQGVATITNDDAQPAISINNASVAEGNSGTRNAAFTVSLSNASFQTITVNYGTANNTATASSDFLAANGTVTFAPGQTSQPLNITVNGDTLVEPNETFTVNLSGATNASIADSQGVGTITNDDTQPNISINDVTLNEGNSGTRTATFTLSLTNASSQTITVNFATANVSATAGTDYVAASGTVTFTGGQLTRTINVTVNGDTVFEPNETFNVNLSGATNATIADNQGGGTITNDDGQPSISINNVSVNEGNAGTTTATFTVSLSHSSTQTIIVNFATANNTAIAGTHYVATSGTLTFASGTTTQPINVLVNGDSFNETPTFIFHVNLSSATNATIADNQGAGTILDDDPPVLATEETSQRAIAFDSLFFIREPIAIPNLDFLGTDRRTRIVLFATNLTLTTGLVVTAEAVDSQQIAHQLPVEFVGSLPVFVGFTQLNVRLPEGISPAGDLRITITVNGQTSNLVLVAVKP
jgi:hypothetical protein